METMTFNSPKPPAFGEIYARRRQESDTTLATPFLATIPERSKDTPATSFPVAVSGDARKISRILNEVMALWKQTSSEAENANIFVDALNFVGAMPSYVLPPRIWADDAEVVFEWISDDRHAVASCEGDGVIGYTYRVHGQFVPGQETAARSNSFPADLIAYLR